MEQRHGKLSRPPPSLENPAACGQCDSEQSTLSTSVGCLSPCCGTVATTTASVSPVVDESPSSAGNSSTSHPGSTASSRVDKADPEGRDEGLVGRGKNKHTELLFHPASRRRPTLSAQFLLKASNYSSQNVNYSSRGSATPANVGRLSDALDSIAREMKRLDGRRRLTASSLVPSILAELNLSPRADARALKHARRGLHLWSPRAQSSSAKTSPHPSDFAGKLDMLTKQLLVFSYSFVAFHTLALHFCPSLYSALRFGPQLNTNPLLQQPHPDSLFGFFFFFINTSIHVFVKRGVSAALIHAGLLHLARLVIVRGTGPQKSLSRKKGIAKVHAQFLPPAVPFMSSRERNPQRIMTADGYVGSAAQSPACAPKSTCIASAIGDPSPLAFSAAWGPIERPRKPETVRNLRAHGLPEAKYLAAAHARCPGEIRRRMRFVSRVLAVACFLSLFVTITAFLWGGWPAKAVGFPDIYLGSLTKKGSFLGPETLRSALRSPTAEATLDRIKTFRQESIVSPTMSSRSVLAKWSLDASKGLMYYQLIVFAGFGFLLDIWGAWTKVRLIRQFLRPRDLVIPAVAFTVAMSYAAVNLHGIPACNGNDKHWVDFRTQEMAAHVNTHTHDKVNTPPLLYSVYIPMRDGIEIAADVYLPKPYYETAEKLASHQHRIDMLDRALKKTTERLQVLHSQDARNNDRGGDAGQVNLGEGRDPKLPRKTVFKRYQEIRNLQSFQAHVEKRLKEERADYDTILASVKKLPTYLDITRYNRRTEVYWPLSMLRMWKNPRGATVNVWSFTAQQAFTANGYAVVVVDSRGTGASFGERYVDLSEVEIQDFSEIVAWIKSQWFSNGKIGGGGLSYDGMTGLNAAAEGGIDAVLSLFTPMHVFGDLLVPGGVICSSFLKDYAGMTYGFERTGSPVAHILNNPWKYPLHVLLGFSVAFGPGSGVFGREGDLAIAIARHRKNWDMAHTIKMVEYYDDVVTLHNNETASAAEFGIHETVMRKLAERNVSVYVVGGYCDSASVRGASRLYDYMKRNAPTSKSKLLLGSWSHGGRRSCNPYAGSFPCFEADQYLDAVRFFDCRLKGECWGGIEDEPSVHYWQVGAEEWRTSEYFPPERQMSYVDFHLNNEKFVNLNRLECKRTSSGASLLALGKPADVCLSPQFSLSLGDNAAPKCPLPTSPFTVRTPGARGVSERTAKQPRKLDENDIKRRKSEQQSTTLAKQKHGTDDTHGSSSAHSSAQPSTPHSADEAHMASPFSLPVLLPATFDLRLSTFEHRLHDLVQSITLHWQQLQTHVELLLRQARDHQLTTEDERGNQIQQPLTISSIIGVALAGFEEGWGEASDDLHHAYPRRTAAARAGIQHSAHSEDTRRAITKKPTVGRLKDSFSILETDPNAYSMSLDARRGTARLPEAYIRPSLAREIPIAAGSEKETLDKREPRLTLAKKLLLKKFPSKLSPRLHYDVEYFATTGVFSRWVIAQHPFRQAIHYGNRLFARRVRPDFPINLSPLPGAGGESFHPSPFYLDSMHASLLSWTSGVLLEDMDVVGSAWVHLQMFVKSCTDISVFVYLEDVEVNGGYSHYVTEGKIVVSHRPVKVKTESPIGSPDTVFRSFTKSSRVPLNSSGELIEFTMPLEPVSWTFKKGHSIRLSLAGSDVDNFEPAVQNRMILPRQWTVITANAKLRLPVHHTNAVGDGRTEG
ncbi:hydrolase CocE/NonD family protein [Besnoitia besnoiti]|uniref:Hydrolase CocE/NonD family protein n=1 Tax=Besnoitia besnoiti TaxID=94643 RepID=A0A2A9MI23_BESBE|nr:hydrolase CocE/NonD family protein [Besnoitia besnoiti]PFH35050.1 hydrolase CocE/NonD family protein [Besnoitia besnoiti]